jgi:hypothetical protein
MRGHNTSGGYYQSYVNRATKILPEHKKTCPIGPGLCELPRTFLPRQSAEERQKGSRATPGGGELGAPGFPVTDFSTEGSRARTLNA